MCVTSGRRVSAAGEAAGGADGVAPAAGAGAEAAGAEAEAVAAAGLAGVRTARALGTPCPGAHGV